MLGITLCFKMAICDIFFAVLRYLAAVQVVHFFTSRGYVARCICWWSYAIFIWQFMWKT